MKEEKRTESNSTARIRTVSLFVHGNPEGIEGILF